MNEPTSVGTAPGSWWLSWRVTFWVGVRCQGGKYPSLHKSSRARFQLYLFYLFYLFFFRSIQPEDKSFAVGIQFMLLRILGKLKSVEMPPWKIMAALWNLCGFHPRAVLGLQKCFLCRVSHCCKPPRLCVVRRRRGISVGVHPCG